MVANEVVVTEAPMVVVVEVEEKEGERMVGLVGETVEDNPSHSNQCAYSTLRYSM